MHYLKKKLKSVLCLAPTIPFFVLAIGFLILPFISMVKSSFTDPSSGAFSLVNYQTCFTKGAYVASIKNSLQVSSIATAVVMVASFFIALAVFSTGITTKKWFMPIMNISQNFAGFPLAFAFILMLGKQGFFRLLFNKLGSSLLDNYSLYSYEGIIPLYIWFGIPLCVLLLLPGFDAVHREWKEASTLLGCSSAGFWTRIGIPNVMPTLLGTLSVVFADSITTYTTVYIIISSNAALLPIKIGTMFGGDLKARPEVGCALSVIMIMMILIVMVLCNIGKRISAKRGVSV
ncbi:MAG: ABC transporter permease subunit [Firmicutes bacterium]|nr:ABC transporter permease subunit [Bacillota bacterium]